MTAQTKTIFLSKLTIVFLFFFVGCAPTKLTLIPRGEGTPIDGNIDAGVGYADVKIGLPSGEMFQGRLIWLTPQSVMNSGIVTTGSQSFAMMGLSQNNTAMYMGTITGNKGTKMRIQLYCNASTLRCIGTGITNDSVEYDIQR